ncbi:NRAMP family divalent metal transporter [Endozoicomonas lisbonensis]|uniref:NRAMP family divalent metal transporter n=1 Tax=Endozoicomonas lisbonensis TaxID=3120522 RepID=UPI003395D90E
MSTPAMSSSSSPAASPRLSFSALGPGIMVAAAAIGGSHLVASTQAGAVYGWQLVGLIILVNFFKYPFFQFGARYSAATGESLLAGYARLGKPWLVLFLVLNVFAGVVNIAALLGLTGALATFIVPGVTPPVLAGVAAVISLMIVLRGHYRMVDVVSKWIVLLLAVVTVLATLLAFSQPAAAAPGFVAPTPWTLASLGVLISLMGWMPAPVEVSAMNSVWSRNKFMNRGRPDMRVALFDLNVGFNWYSTPGFVLCGIGSAYSAWFRCRTGNQRGSFQPTTGGYVRCRYRGLESLVGDHSSTVLYL